MKLLDFDDLSARLRAVAGALPDPRTGDNPRFSMPDPKIEWGDGTHECGGLLRKPKAGSGTRRNPPGFHSLIHHAPFALPDSMDQ